MRSVDSIRDFYEKFCDFHIQYFQDYRPAQLWLDFLGFVQSKKKRDPFFCEGIELLGYLKEYTENNSPYFKGWDLDVYKEKK